MPAPMLKVGDITIIPVSDGGFTAPPANFMPNVPAEAWKTEVEHLNAEGHVPLNFGCFLIREGDTWTLVDNGFGQAPGSPGGRLMGELEKAKLSPDDIRRVIITHLHPDHVGGTTVEKDGKREIICKNARHVVQRIDWEYYTQPDVMKENAYIATQAVPLKEAGLLDLIDGEQAISAGVTALPTPGHTPGHQSLLVSSGGEKAIILGDVTHSTVQLNREDWCPGFDLDMPTSARTRAAIFERIEREGLKVCAGHYPYPSIGSIVRVEGKRRWQGI
jgi:glyoxylase-like metal-dependent hydrolase (beta-lactamase superfamily II)